MIDFEITFQADEKLYIDKEKMILILESKFKILLYPSIRSLYQNWLTQSFCFQSTCQSKVMEEKRFVWSWCMQSYHLLTLKGLKDGHFDPPSGFLMNNSKTN